MTSSFPPINKLKDLSKVEQSSVLDNLFEKCETLTEYLLPLLFSNSSKNYKSYGELIEDIRSYLNDLKNSQDRDQAKINTIISAHPRLGPSKKPTSTTLSTHSASEQSQLAGSAEETKQLLELNELYESNFPGLRFVVFVNGRSRESIMHDMRVRINRNDLELEIDEAFNAMCDIAFDRACKLGAIKKFNDNKL